MLNNPPLLMKKMMIYLAAFALLFAGCEAVVDPDRFDLDETPQRLVIEGYVHPEAGPYYVTVRRPASYFATNEYEGVEDATVVLEASSGAREVLKMAPEGNGRYATTALQAEAGQQYRLSVTVGPHRYEAAAWLLPPVAVDRVTHRHKEAVEHLNEAGYFLTVQAQDDAATTDYYLLRGYRNGRRMDGGADDYVVLRDFAFNGSRIRYELPFRYQKGDTARVELCHLDDAAYRFYLSVRQQLDAGSSPFAAPPGNVNGNVRTVGDAPPAIGFFGALTCSPSEDVVIASEAS